MAQLEIQSFKLIFLVLCTLLNNGSFEKMLPSGVINELFIYTWAKEMKWIDVMIHIHSGFGI